MGIRAHVADCGRVLVRFAQTLSTAEVVVHYAVLQMVSSLDLTGANWGSGGLVFGPAIGGASTPILVRLYGSTG